MSRIFLILAGCTGISTLIPSTGACQRSEPFQVEYVVQVADTAAHLFHVTATFRHVHQNRLDLALPAWTPGWYSIENYARNVLRFTVTNGAGTRLRAPLLHAQTWSVETGGTQTVVVDFDYLATLWAVNQAKITSRNAFFTGTQLFLEPIGHRDAATSVRFVTPRGWRIATALQDTRDSTIFTAPNYDALVDAPTLLGDFDLFRFEVDGKPHFFVEKLSHPIADSIVKAGIARFSKMVQVERDIFGSLPYDKYLVFLLPGTAETNASGSLEHSNSYVGAAGPIADVPYANAHEFFHLWNVKRIRPAEMWPYDYSRPNETPSLWMSEGLTDYYAGVVNYRAGFVSESSFLGHTAAVISNVESSAARPFISASDASISTWLGYDNPAAFWISYYSLGGVIGALLNLSVLHDTKGARDLDDVMRALYKGYYLRGRGFTPEDMITVVGSVAGTDYHDFFRRFVTGVEVPPYAAIFGYAGLRVSHTDSTLAVFDAVSTTETQGRLIRFLGPFSPAALGGLRKGDVLTAMNGVPIDKVPFRDPAGVGRWLQITVGTHVTFRVLRDGKSIQLPVILGTQNWKGYRIEADSAATPEQLAIRRRWLFRSSAN